MKNIMIVSVAILMSIGLVGCNTMNNANRTVGQGVKYTANTAGKGVKVVSNTGAFVGRGVTSTVATGTRVVTGQPTKVRAYHHKNQVIYRNGHRYVMQNGKYVLVR